MSVVYYCFRVVLTAFRCTSVRHVCIHGRIVNETYTVIKIYNNRVWNALNRVNRI